METQGVWGVKGQTDKSCFHPITLSLKELYETGKMVILGLNSPSSWLINNIEQPLVRGGSLKGHAEDTNQFLHYF
jgi:hypothetical protein